MEVKLAHYSDPHLGHEQFAARTPAGLNQRAADLVLAHRRFVEQIVDEDPPLVILAGDVTEHARPAWKYVLEAKEQITRLAGIRPDGTRRQVVIPPGNHDESGDLTEPCWLHVLNGLPGVHISSSPFEQFHFDPDRDNCDATLADVVVTAVPHHALSLLAREEREGGEGFAKVQPVDGKVNVLTTHGVAEGSDLFYRAIGREYPIPGELLRRDWDYVALGHYHKCGPVHPGSSVIDPTRPSKIWYSGSTETIKLADVDGREARERYWLDVTVARGEQPEVTRRAVPTRHVMYLPDLEVGGLDQGEITQRMLANVRAESVTDAIVVQRLYNVTPDVWATTDRDAVESAASDALHYNVVPHFARRMNAEVEQRDHTLGLGDVPEILEQLLGKHVPEGDRDEVKRTTIALLDEVGGGEVSFGDVDDAGNGDDGADEDGEDGERTDNTAEEVAA